MPSTWGPEHDQDRSKHVGVITYGVLKKYKYNISALIDFIYECSSDRTLLQVLFKHIFC
jgi:hypothetical protein